jgi:hypothetical protein
MYTHVFSNMYLYYDPQSLSSQYNPDKDKHKRIRI